MSTQVVNSAADEQVLTDALEWVGIFRERAITPDEFAKWEEWLAVPEHRQAYDEVERMLRAAGDVGDAHWPTPDEMEADGYHGEVEIRRWRAATRDSKRKSSRARFALGRVRSFVQTVPFRAALGGLAVAGILMSVYLAGPGRDSTLAFATGKGEHRICQLPDRSEIFLGAESSVVVSYSDNERSVVLDSGQAFFDVAKDKSRKFVVTAGPTTVQALGTRFSVQKEAQQVKVAVVTGTVQVTDLQDTASASGVRNTGLSVTTPPNSAIIRAGQQVRNGLGYDVTAVESVDIDVATSWKEGRLKFSGDRLDLVVAAVNRYSSQEIVIHDSNVAELSYTGTVFRENIEEWIDSLDQAFPVRVKDAGGRKIILARSTD